MNIVVDGRYQIIKRLGKGGFAHTYLAKNLMAPGEPKCVVKQLRPKVEHPRMLQLFKLEAAILARFKHSQIPKMVECFEHQGDRFLVQDFVAGDDLSKEFTIGHQWSEAKVIRFLREMLKVLGYVHQKKAIHRDIKPTNIIRRWDNGQLCLIDFGAVQDLECESIAPTVVGTPGYHAPEQAEGVATFSSDIYALGMTAIQFLTGHYPLHLPRNESKEVVWRDLTSISDRLATILEQMTRVDEIDRYECTTAVLADLETLPLAGEDENLGLPTQLLDRSSHQELTSKIMAVAVLLGLGFVSTATIVSRVQSVQSTVGGESLVEK
jgi:eukaryotic-like serine/threonine-protein kinase